MITIDINRAWDDHPSLVLGTVVVTDATAAREHIDEDPEDWIKERWEDWTEACPNANSNDEFITWLHEVYGLSIVKTNHQVQVGV